MGDNKEMKKTAADDASSFVVLAEAIPDVILEIRYYSTYNFIGERIRGYEEPIALLSKEAVSALKEAAAELKEKGYCFRIYDAYRPQCAVDHFVAWGKDVGDVRMKAYFYPDLNKDEVFEKGFIAYRSGHSRGSTVDLTLFDMQKGKDVDMGGPFDWFGELSCPSFRGITEEQYQNRILLRETMIRHGFEPYEGEWWHFTLKDEPYPDTYFTFPIRASSLQEE